MLEKHVLAAFIFSSAIPLTAAELLREKYCFDFRLPLYLFTLAPAAGALTFTILALQGFGLGTLLYAGLAYFITVPFLGAGWSVLIGVIGWMLALRIQTSARFGGLARFSIGGWLGFMIGAIFLPSYCYFLGILNGELIYWIVSGACAGSVGGITVVSFVPANPEIKAAA
jgi:hypothetical protein